MTDGPEGDGDLAAFEAGAEAWLAGVAGRRPERGRFRWGDGDDRVVELWSEHDPDADGPALEAARAWRRTRFDAGYGWIDGPPELGGRGLGPAHARAYARLEARYEVPAQDWFKLGPIVGPVLAADADPGVRHRYVPGLFRGDVIACELFSEPGAGSDLAGVACRATRDGDHWVLEGQKVWTSDAHIADIGLALARSDPDRLRHGGLTAFLVDLHDPAVTVRPLRQMTGGAAFNEVFLDGVRVPADHVVGEINGGWRVAVATLMLERRLVAGGHGRGGVGIANGERLIELVRHAGLADDPLIRQELASVLVRFRVAGYLNRRRDLPPDAVIMNKLALASNLTAVAGLVARVLGPRLVADTGEWGTFAWAAFVLGAPGNHITVGTDETIRTILGERVLGLPREPSPT